MKRSFSNTLYEKGEGNQKYFVGGDQILKNEGAIEIVRGAGVENQKSWRDAPKVSLVLLSPAKKYETYNSSRGMSFQAICQNNLGA